MKKTIYSLRSSDRIYIAPISRTITIKPEKSFLQEWEDSGTAIIDDPVNPGTGDNASGVTGITEF